MHAILLAGVVQHQFSYGQIRIGLLGIYLATKLYRVGS